MGVNSVNLTFKIVMSKCEIVLFHCKLFIATREVTFLIEKNGLPLPTQKTPRNTADAEHRLNLNVYLLKY